MTQMPLMLPKTDRQPLKRPDDEHEVRSANKRP
jgi:hypothetical protein